MTRFIVVLSLALGFALGGCSGDDEADAGPPDAGARPYGESCTEDSDCQSQICVRNVCSEPCKRQTDCPLIRGKAFDCGQIKDDVIGCYPRKYNTQKYGMGYDCSLDSKCGVGYRCMGEVGETDRYCSNKCQSDMDCPPRYFCSQARVGKDLEPDHWCRRRQFCHPCVIDDQCGGPDDLCVKDKNGNGYCSKACTKSGSTCPPYAQCEDAGNNKLQCRPKSGACFMSFTGEGALCDPCVVHGWTTKPGVAYPLTIAEEGGCKPDGFCLLLDRYSGEGACVEPCAADGTCPSAAYGCSAAESALTQSLGKQVCVPYDGEYIDSCVK